VNALDQKAAAAEARAEAEAEGAARVRGAAARKPLVLEEGVQLSAPFSLRSIGVLRSVQRLVQRAHSVNVL
jgi:hypothetical protein